MKMHLAVLALVGLLWGAGSAAAAPEAWTTYVNGRFGYSIEYPDIFDKSEEPENGDGVWLESAGQGYKLTLSGGHNVQEHDGAGRLRSRLEEVAHILPGSDLSGPDWYRLIYSDEGGRDGEEHLFHEYGRLNQGHWADFTLVYPLEEKARFEPIAARMEASLKLPPAGDEAPAPPQMDSFSIKDGRVIHKSGAALDVEILETPAGSKGGIKHWAVIGADQSEALTEAETGVWFFGESGGALSFIPLESEYEFQGLAWGPAGDRLVLTRGSGVRPDLFLELYAEGLEKKAEFGGLREELEWLDQTRFVFTRIDDGLREGGRFANLSYGLKLSVVMYDSASGQETVLKEADALRNYSFDSISEDGREINIIESSVKSPADWADEDKIQTRSLTAPTNQGG